MYIGILKALYRHARFNCELPINSSVEVLKLRGLPLID